MQSGAGMAYGEGVCTLHGRYCAWDVAGTVDGKSPLEALEMREAEAKPSNILKRRSVQQRASKMCRRLNTKA